MQVESEVRNAAGLKGLADRLVRQIGYGLGTVFFIPNPWIGMILWAALFSVPRLGAFALLGLLVGGVCKHFLQPGEPPHLGGGIKTNALLAATAVAWLTTSLGLDIPAQVLIAVLAAFIAAVITCALMVVLNPAHFPVLVTGYCLVASALFAICPRCTVLAAGTLPVWPAMDGPAGWSETFLWSMGALVYAPSLLFGGLVCLAVVMWSRMTFLAGLAGWVGGSVLASAAQSIGIAYDFQPLSYNFFIVGAALGAALFLPGRAGLLVAVIGGAVCAFVALVLQAASSGSAMCYLPISSVLTIWLGMAALALGGQRAILCRYSSTRFPPEIAWLRQAYYTHRFGPTAPLLAVPLSGPLIVAQGFSGDVTHTGRWCHAFDFQVLPEGSSAKDCGVDASSWGRLVLSPVSGVVEQVRADVADNVLGGSNFADNWGNSVIVRTDAGGWVLLSHLMQGSVAVASGTRVLTGAVVGRVGNSGRSPIPHLHMQYQGAPTLGAATRPFKLANYLVTESLEKPWLRWIASGVPALGSAIQAAWPNPMVYDLLSTMMPGQAVWYCRVSGRLPSTLFRPGDGEVLRIGVMLDEAGHYRFDSGKSGRLIASLDPDAWRITELERVRCPLLRLIGVAIPSLPYALRSGMEWVDAPALPVHGMGFTVSFSPLVGKHFPTGRYECLETATDQASFSVGAIFEGGGDLPQRVQCKIARYCGPVSLRAEFPEGVIEFSQFSFEPGYSTEPVRQSEMADTKPSTQGVVAASQ